MPGLDPRIRIENEILERIEKKYSEEELANHLMHLLADGYPLHSAAVLAAGPGGENPSVFAHRGLSGNFIKAIYARKPLPVIAAAIRGEVAVPGRDPRAKDPSFRLEHEYESLFAAPCRLQGETIGVFIADSPDPDLFAPATRETFRACSRLATLFLGMRTLRGKISRVPDVDTVTGLAGFKIFHEVLHREIGRGKKFRHPVSLVFMKIRGLREMNEVYGHVAADEALAEVAARIRSALRDVDFAARSGGSIYVVMPQLAREDAAKAASRIAAAMDAAPVGKGEVSIRIAVGVAAYPKDGETERVLIPHVDAMVHESVRKGGNAVTVFGD